MIGVGDRAPNFDLAAADGSRLTLTGMLARGPAVVFFYPKDQTPGCTAEACAFRDAYTAFVQSHAAFAERQRLPYPLASDPGGAVRKSFGVPKTLGIFPGRVTYVIDRAGIVRSVFNAMFASDKHVEAALQALATLD
jgi:peroxiredoxin Q/BCP